MGKVSRIAWLIYGDLGQPTGGYIYDRIVIEYLSRQGIEVEVINIPRLPYALNVVWNFWLLWRLGKKEYSLVIEDELVHPAVFIFNRWAKRKKGWLLAGLVHNLHWLDVKDRWYKAVIRWMEKRMLADVDFALTTSQTTKEEVIRLGVVPGAVSVIKPGFDLIPPCAAQKQASSTVRLLFVGNCIKRKGLHLLVEALSLLGDLDIHLDVVGGLGFEPRYARRVKDRVRALGLEDRVSFQGSREPNELSRWYAQADIFVLPSLYEGYGIVFAEAMSFGLPIISTSAGAIPEVVEQGKTGLLLPREDIDALAGAIRQLAENPAQREALGGNGLEHSKTLPSWNETGEEFYRLVRQFLST